MMRWVLFCWLGLVIVPVAAQEVLVAWQVDQVQSVVVLPDGQMIEAQRALTSFQPDRQWLVYELPDRHAALTFLQQLRGQPGVIFAELDAEVVA